MDITKRFDRILQIFFLLQSKSVVSAEELQKRFEISLRTIYRDLKALEVAGIPIVNESGSGYSIMEGFRLQPSRFSQEEILSLMVAEKVMQKHETEFVKKHFEAALIKIKSSFQVHQKRDFLHLEDTIHLKNNLTSNDYLPNIIDVLLNSTLKKKITHIDYLKSSDVHAVGRSVESIGIFYEHGCWYLLAYCHLRKDYRNFRLDRIKKVWVLEENFTISHPPIHEFRNKGVSETRTKIEIRVDRKYANFLYWDRQIFGFTGEEILDDFVLMYFDCSLPVVSFVRWFIKFVDIAEIIEPAHLNHELVEIMEAGLKRIKIKEVIS
ncbi:helix-turn-helix transcriptional regulator [Pedobacter sp. KACC 23697]|uniref:YafY family protein n=1 Tax=Pedobacter sp. KACC 23697 TaxID=3149230 RepID=A0AAU7K6F0_9SPHI